MISPVSSADQVMSEAVKDCPRVTTDTIGETPTVFKIRAVQCKKHNVFECFKRCLLQSVLRLLSCTAFPRGNSVSRSGIELEAERGFSAHAAHCNAL